jgi:DNA-binding transcriptional MerR regulator
VRIGEVARAVGVSTDTVRFYERAGLLPAPWRRDNHYRDYGPDDMEHLRLLIGLRRLDLPLEDAARLARWCHSGHCDATSSLLPELVAARRAEVAARIESLVELDRRLADLENHLQRRSPAEGRRGLAVLGPGAACCDAAAVALAGETGCACCSPGAEA